MTSILDSATKRLKDTPGVVACKNLTSEDRNLVLRLESKTAVPDRTLGMLILNEGIAEVLARDYVIVIAHSRELRHPPGPIVVIRDDTNIVGEEIWQADQLTKLSHDPNAILLGKSLVLYRDTMSRARGKALTLSYRALPFPELDTLEGVTDVVSVTVGPLTHIRLSQSAGWDFNDSNLGTVLIGFNERDRRD